MNNLNYVTVGVLGTVLALGACSNNPDATQMLNTTSIQYKQEKVEAAVSTVPKWFTTLPTDEKAIYSVIGPNGAGKSTFLKGLTGALPRLAGRRVTGAHLRIGYFDQQQLEVLDLEASPLLHLQRLRPGVREQVIFDFLGGFNFKGERAKEVIGPFSGGEKARLALAMVVWQDPNVLILDEPTNHLDIEAVE